MRILTVALLTLLLAGCAAKPESHTVNGVIVAVAADKGVLTIQHEDIPGFMAAMTMPFEVADKRLIGDLKAGD